MANLKRTTLRLEKTLLKEAKRLALLQDGTLQDVINDALKRHLMFEAQKTAKIKFRDYHMGKVKGGLTRSKIYEKV